MPMPTTTAYPATLDATAAIVPDTGANPDVFLGSPAAEHPDHHKVLAAATEALQAKVGIGASTPSVGKLLIGNSAGTSTWGHTLVDATGGEDFLASVPPTHLYILDHTNASPKTTLGATMRIVRWENLDRTVMTNPGEGAYNAALHIESHGTAADTAQVTGILASAQGGNTSTVGSDICGILAVGHMTTPGGISVTGGLYAEGRTDYATAGAVYGAEIRIGNYTATDGTYSSASGPDRSCVWATSYGTAKASAFYAGHAIDASSKALVGIGFTAGSVTDSDFRTDTSSTRALDVRGSHTVGLDMSTAVFSARAITVPNGSTGAITAVSSGGAVHNLIHYDSGNSVLLGSGSANVIYSFKRHDMAGGVYIGGQNIQTDTSTGTTFGTTTSEKVGMHGAKVAQQTVTGSRGGNAALASLLTALAAKGIVVDGTTA